MPTPPAAGVDGLTYAEFGPQAAPESAACHQHGPGRHALLSHIGHLEHDQVERHLVGRQFAQRPRIGSPGRLVRDRGERLQVVRSRRGGVAIGPQVIGVGRRDEPGRIAARVAPVDPDHLLAREHLDVFQHRKFLGVPTETHDQAAGRRVVGDVSIVRPGIAVVQRNRRHRTASPKGQ